PSEIGKNYVADIGLVGDCQTVLNEISFRILRELQKHDFQKERPIENIIKFKESVGTYIDEDKMFSESVPIKPQTLTREIQESLPDDAIVFIDVGNILCWTIHYMQFKNPNIVPPFGFLPMGYATSAAIGGKLAAPDRPVVAIVGDGCFQMNGMEIATAVNYNIPVVWIVQNNAKLGLVHELQRFDLGDKTVSTTFKEVNLAKVAEGLGAKGYRIKKPGELSSILPKAIESQVPTVIDVIIDPNEVPPIESWVKGVREISSRLDYL
ncbi:MAG TPA: thiamine pyrophosphate-dependent enzyme, partial [Methanobacterium sp.]|nr:thiamine pyrophosphate-dependent enzyme [Methanobacterium sp.]